jgi:hypothetical protein
MFLVTKPVGSVLSNLKKKEKEGVINGFLAFKSATVYTIIAVDLHTITCIYLSKSSRSRKQFLPTSMINNQVVLFAKN